MFAHSHNYVWLNEASYTFMSYAKFDNCAIFVAASDSQPLAGFQPHKYKERCLVLLTVSVNVLLYILSYSLFAFSFPDIMFVWIINL